MIDYSELCRKDYWRKHTRFARFVVEIGQNVTLLSYPRPLEQSGTELPSWYPNLLRIVAASRLLEHQWNRKTSYRDFAVSAFLGGETDVQDSRERADAIKNHNLFFAQCSEGKSFLQVLGFIADRISEVVEYHQLLHWREGFPSRYL